MDRKKALGLIGSVLIAAQFTVACGSKKKPIVVGSKNFTEQVILGEIIALHLEHRLPDVKILRQLNLSGTLITYQALVTNQITLYPEYTGTIEAEILKEATTNAEQAFQRSRQELERTARLELLDPLGIDNYFAMVIRGEDARKYKIDTLSQAAAVKEGWKLGAGYEFEQRLDGMPALAKYHLPMSAAPRTMDLGLLYRALEDGKVTMVAANATDGPLATHDWVVLKDDQHVFGPYQACVLTRLDALAAEPRLKPALAELSGKFTNEMMRKMNADVDVRHLQARDVAAEFLKQAGLR